MLSVPKRDFGGLVGITAHAQLPFILVSCDGSAMHNSVHIILGTLCTVKISRMLHTGPNGYQIPVKLYPFLSGCTPYLPSSL